VISRRERMVLLEPLGKGIMATMLRYPYEVRGEQPYFEDIPDLDIPKEMRDLAGHIIETKSADFEPAKFEDRYENAMIELVKSKETGRPVAAPEAPRPSNVVNLMDALRKSIAAEPPAASKKAASKTSAERAPKSAKKARPASRKAG
jgi:DNA end-binding protein Ku